MIFLYKYVPNNTIRNFSPTAKVYTIYRGINNNKILIKQ